MLLACGTVRFPAGIDPPVMLCAVERQQVLGPVHIGAVWQATAERHRIAKVRTVDSEHADPKPIPPSTPCAPGGSSGTPGSRTVARIPTDGAPPSLPP